MAEGGPNREAYKADPKGAMDRFDLTAAERKLIVDNDWLNLGKAGCNVYGLMRIASLYGVGLYPMGAQQLGISYDDFLETRNAKGAT